jgi:hypothetical protein
MHRRIAALTLALALVGLTACAAPSSSDTAPRSGDEKGDDGQTTAQACQLIHETITDATDSFEATTDADPNAVVAAMRAATDTLSGVSAQVTNDDVAELLPDLIGMFGETADVMESIIDGDAAALGDLTALGDEFRTTTTRFQELCGA